MRVQQRNSNLMADLPRLPNIPDDQADPQRNCAMQQNPPREHNGQQNDQAKNPILVANDRGRAIRAYTFPIFDELNPGIVRPAIEATNFEMKPIMFQML